MNSANLYINSILSQGAIPLITKPTRISHKSPTTINHIITNNSKYKLQSFMVKSDLTDHYPIFCVINKNFTNNKKNIEKMFAGRAGKALAVVRGRRIGDGSRNVLFNSLFYVDVETCDQILSIK